LNPIIDAHGEGGGGWRSIKVDPPAKMFTKLVSKNAIKPEKGVPSLQYFHNAYIPSPQNLAKT
jgi:hypothetical protein